MKHEIIGSTLIFTSAFLYASRFIAAAIFIGPGLKGWSDGLFEDSYRYVGSELTIFSIIALVVGITILLIGFRAERIKNGKD